MMARQFYDINGYKERHSAEKRMFFPLKSSQTKWEEKMDTYFRHHPLVLWTVACVGMPIGILCAVGLAATVFGMVMFGIMSIM